MSWSQLNAEHRAHLEQTLTTKQLNVLTLHLAGCSQRRIATMLNISRSTVRDHLTIAENALAALTRKDAA